MANPSTLYRFRIALSDIERGVYEALDLRLAMHPSETESYLLTRVLAYALSFEDGLEFSQGLCAPDEPAIRLAGPNGGLALAIEIGNPAARRLHKASKAARRLCVYTYKDPENIKREAQGEQIHRVEEIEIYAFEPSFLKSLAEKLVRDNDWSLVRDDGQVLVTFGGDSISGVLHCHRLTT